MKKMRIKKGSRGDEAIHRLFFYLVDKGMHIKQYYVIKPHLLYVETNKGAKLFKKYHQSKTVMRTYQWIELLKEAGFTQAVNFEVVEDCLVISGGEDIWWGMMPYVSRKSDVSFQHNIHRKQVVKLLSTYHQAAQRAFVNLTTAFPTYRLIDVWKRRLAFVHHRKTFIQSLIGKSKYDQIYGWGKDSLLMMSEFESAHQHPLTIIHGDTASHNFLYAADHQYYLIDFDCAAQSSQLTDYIQLAHRFLLQENVSVDMLRREERFMSCFASAYFTAALRFPAMLLLSWYLFLTARIPTYQQAQQLKTWTTKQMMKAEVTHKEIMRIFPNI
jgi:thiamine kinase-like enzyme